MGQMMNLLAKVVFGFFLAFVVYLFLGASLHFVIFPQPDLEPSMYPESGITFTREETGETLVYQQTARETDGKLFQFEWFVAADGSVPAAHAHAQEQRFEVREGNLIAIMGGEGQEVTAGETVIVPPGISHQAFNNGNKDLRCIAEIRPAGKYDLLFWQIDQSGKNPSISVTIIFQLSMYEEWFPWPQRVVAYITAPTARLLGYRRYYADRSCVPLGRTAIYPDIREGLKPPCLKSRCSSSLVSVIPVEALDYRSKMDVM